MSTNKGRFPHDYNIILHGEGGWGGAIHSWKNTRTAQSRLCYFFKLAVLFLVDTQVLIFFHFAVKIDIKDR